jgi:tetratricopeptide (TPR) repeat protein
MSFEKPVFAVFRLPILGLCLWLLPVLAEPGFVVDGDGKRWEGEVTADSGGAVTVKADADKVNRFNPGRYRYAMIRKPPEVARLEEALAAKRTAEIRDKSGTLYRKYRYLGWADLICYCEGMVFLQSADPKGAEESFDRGIRAVGDQGENRDRCRMGMVQAWQKLGKQDEAAKELTELVRSPAMPVAAAALTIRAKNFEKQGNKRAAIADYLKIVIFSKKEAAKRDNAECEAARQAAIRLLQELKEPKHSKTLEAL